jgi:TRAP-type C4-dicarboxylate transport system substrate-binding protein
MKKKRIRVFCILGIFWLALNPARLAAQRGSRGDEATVEVKLASPMPKDSSWGTTLDRLAAEWAKATNNAVRFRILHNGQEGGEAKMLSSLASNNIQAALFTSFGLSEICPSVMTLSVPFYIKNDAEMTAVLKEVQPLLEAQVAKTDYYVMVWSRAGWVYFFSKEPVFVPDDLRRQKIASNPDAGKMNTAFKSMGFPVVESETNDLGTKLASGAVGAIYNNPALVASLQLHSAGLKNMMNTPIAPAMGGVVINKVTWNKISAANQREILRVTRRIATDFDSSMPQIINNAISVMSRNGLKVNKPTQAQEDMWYNDMQRVIPPLLGTTFDKDVYQKIGEVLTKYRGR